MRSHYFISILETINQLSFKKMMCTFIYVLDKNILIILSQGTLSPTVSQCTSDHHPQFF